MFNRLSGMGSKPGGDGGGGGGSSWHKVTVSLFKQLYTVNASKSFV